MAFQPAERPHRCLSWCRRVVSLAPIKTSSVCVFSKKEKKNKSRFPHGESRNHFYFKKKIRNHGRPRRPAGGDAIRWVNIACPTYPRSCAPTRRGAAGARARCRAASLPQHESGMHDPKHPSEVAKAQGGARWARAVSAGKPPPFAVSAAAAAGPARRCT